MRRRDRERETELLNRAKKSETGSDSSETRERGSDPSRTKSRSRNRSDPKGPPVDRSELRPVPREEIADFVLRREAQIRAIARRKIPDFVRGLFDSEDVLSSVARELDVLADRGLLRPTCERELWALIATMTNNKAISKLRLAARARQLQKEDGVYSDLMARRTEECESDSDAVALFTRMLAAIERTDDRKLFILRLRGASHRAAATALGIKEDACRHRWRVICAELERQLSAELQNDAEA
jgi:uncharacterized membrane protein